jgi:hypothetical protein
MVEQEHVHMRSLVTSTSGPASTSSSINPPSRDADGYQRVLRQPTAAPFKASMRAALSSMIVGPMPVSNVVSDHLSPVDSPDQLQRPGVEFRYQTQFTSDSAGVGELTHGPRILMASPTNATGAHGLLHSHQLTHLPHSLSQSRVYPSRSAWGADGSEDPEELNMKDVSVGMEEE